MKQIQILVDTHFIIQPSPKTLGGITKTFDKIDKVKPPDLIMGFNILEDKGQNVIQPV